MSAPAAATDTVDVFHQVDAILDSIARHLAYVELFGVLGDQQVAHLSYVFTLMAKIRQLTNAEIVRQLPAVKES